MQLEIRKQKQEYSTAIEEKEAVEDEFANRMRELEEIAVDGGGVISSTAILKAQDELKTKIQEQSELIENEN